VTPLLHGSAARWYHWMVDVARPLHQFRVSVKGRVEPVTSRMLKCKIFSKKWKFSEEWLWRPLIWHLWDARTGIQDQVPEQFEKTHPIEKHSSTRRRSKICVLWMNFLNNLKNILIQIDFLLPSPLEAVSSAYSCRAPLAVSASPARKIVPVRKLRTCLTIFDM